MKNISILIIILAAIAFIGTILYWVSFLHISVSIFIGAIMVIGIFGTYVEDN